MATKTPARGHIASLATGTGQKKRKKDTGGGEILVNVIQQVSSSLALDANKEIVMI